MFWAISDKTWSLDLCGYGNEIFLIIVGPRFDFSSLLEISNKKLNTNEDNGI